MLESITLLKEFRCLENPSGPFDEPSWVFVPATAASKIHTARGMPCHTNGSNCAHIGSSAMVLVRLKKGVERTGFILSTACETLVSSFLNKLTSEFLARFTTLTGTSRAGTMNLYQHARFSFYPRKHYVHRWGRVGPALKYFYSPKAEELADVTEGLPGKHVAKANKIRGRRFR